MYHDVRRRQEISPGRSCDLCPPPGMSGWRSYLNEQCVWTHNLKEVGWRRAPPRHSACGSRAANLPEDVAYTPYSLSFTTMNILPSINAINCTAAVSPDGLTVVLSFRTDEREPRWVEITMERWLLERLCQVADQQLRRHPTHAGRP